MTALFHHLVISLFLLASSPSFTAKAFQSFVPLSCNANLINCGFSISELPLSSLVASNQDSRAEVQIPCSSCYFVDYDNGDVLTFAGGLNVIGSLRFPSDANVTIRTTHVVVQGVLTVDPPAVGLRSGFVLYEEPGEHGSHVMTPHGENAQHCSVGCDVGRMPVAVVGGRLDVHGLRDPACPSHVQLLALDATRTVLTVGAAAAGCWWEGPTSIGTALYLTSPDKNMVYDFTGTLAGAEVEAGRLVLSEALPERFGFATAAVTPEYAARVASLRRSFFLTAEKQEAEGEVDGETDKMLIGGHLMVFFTSGVAQQLEGVEITNFGQQGNLGRYPVHFHLCQDVQGSRIAKNVIHKSNQRCFIIHGTHNVTLFDNVAVNTFGHCYVLEDGFEVDNVFERNLGAHLKMPSRILVNVDHSTENDKGPSVFWIMSPMNHWIDNVAAGSIASGFWFDTRSAVRGPSQMLPGAKDFVPMYAGVKTFRDNVSHSNRLFGIQYYSPGWRPKGKEQVMEGSVVYRNGWAGHFTHGNTNMVLKGGLTADNRVNVLNFQNLGFRVDGMRIVARTQNYVDALQGSSTFWSCKWPGSPNPGHVVTGVEFHPFFNKDGAQVHYSNLIFEGFDSGCPQAVPVRMNAMHLWYKVDFSPRSFINTTFLGVEQPETRASACQAIDEGIVSVAVHDKDGSLGPVDRPGTPGFLVSDGDPIFNFANGDGCLPTEDDGLACLRYCPGACLRMIRVRVSNTLAAANMTMVISDGEKQEEAHFTRTSFRKNDGLENGFYGAALPSLPLGKFEVTFKDTHSGRAAWPNYAELEFQEQPDCTGYAEEASVALRKPEFDEGRCGQLIVDGELDGLPDQYGEMGAWQQTWMTLSLVRPGYGGSGTAIRASGNNNCFWYCSLMQWIDASCFVAWTKFDFSAKVRLVDADGESVFCDEENIYGCAIAYLEFYYADKNKKVKHAIGRIEYPTGDTQNDWYHLSGQYIMDDQVELPVKVSIEWEYQKENVGSKGADYIVDNVSLRATRFDPTEMPSMQTSNTPAPTMTSSPTLTQRNLAWRKPTYQTSTSGSMTSDLAVDGDKSGETFTHTGGGKNHWQVDLTAAAFITRVVIYQRKCCNERLNHLAIEIIDLAGFGYPDVIKARKEWNVELAPPIFEFSFEEVEGQIVRIRGTDPEGQILSFAEVEVFGKFLVEPPTVSPTASPSTDPSASLSMVPSVQPSVSVPPSFTPPPTFVEENLALSKPTYQTSTAGSLGSHHAVDGEISGKKFTHTKGGYNYWQVDLETMAKITRIKIYNRVDCCQWRLNHIYVEIRKLADQVVERREYDVEAAPLVFEFLFDVVPGQIVRIGNKDPLVDGGLMSLTEVEVYGKFISESSSPSSVPTSVPSKAQSAVPSSFFSEVPSGASSNPSGKATPSPMVSLTSSPTSTVQCSGLNKPKCKLKKGNCVFSSKKKNKTKTCFPKKEFDHNCSQYTSKKTCVATSYCSYTKKMGCAHKCISDMKKFLCKRVKEGDTATNICKFAKDKNPCHKICCPV